MSAALLGLAGSVSAAHIAVKGSDALILLAQKWAEVYMSKHPATKIQVTGGTGAGFGALQNKSTDLVAVSRKISPAELDDFIQAFGRSPTEYRVCLDSLWVVTNEGNPVQELSLDQVEQIFTGKITHWKQVGGADMPITIYGHAHRSSAWEFFKQHVLKGADFASSAQAMPGTAALLQAVARDKNGIGYGRPSEVKGARALRIKRESGGPAITPSEENVVKGDYPIWRYLYIYLNPDHDRGEIAAFLNWIRGDEGQLAAKEVGYFPLPAPLRER
jgi:phosphate transport system substrate-binding protein